MDVLPTQHVLELTCELGKREIFGGAYMYIYYWRICEGGAQRPPAWTELQLQHIRWLRQKHGCE